jgi:hypothetical protein
MLLHQNNIIDYSLRILYNNIGDNMEIRNSKLIIGKAGGTASNGAKTYKVSLPSTWINELNLDENNRDIELSFDGKKITISSILSFDEFIANAKGHKLLQLDFYNQDVLCTKIIADYTDKKIKVENYTDNIINRAFGVNVNPTWQDYNEFLEDRCVPKSRDRIRDFLDVLGIDEYNPLKIIKKTQGRMADDNQWIEVKEL